MMTQAAPLSHGELSAMNVALDEVLPQNGYPGAAALVNRQIAYLQHTLTQAHADLAQEKARARERETELADMYTKQGENLSHLIRVNNAINEDMETLRSQLAEAIKGQRALEQIAIGFDEDDRDYELVNNLAGCENNHWRAELRKYLEIKAARTGAD